MTTTQLLKKEINQTIESLHDFAKWKLIVTAAIAAAALGLTGPNASPVYWLLLFIPLACAYVDLNCYQYQIRITVISRYLRQQSKDDTLEGYEQLAEQLRVDFKIFDLGKYSQIGSSLVVSIIAGSVTLWEFFLSRKWCGLGVSAVALLLGLGLIWWLWLHYVDKNKVAEGKTDVGPAKAGGPTA